MVGLVVGGGDVKEIASRLNLNDCISHVIWMTSIPTYVMQYMIKYVDKGLILEDTVCKVMD